MERGPYTLPGQHDRAGSGGKGTEQVYESGGAEKDTIETLLTSMLFLMSILSGYPIGAKIIADLYEKT